MIRRVLVSVEGQTEETFLRDVITPYLAGLGIHAAPVILSTKRPASGGKFRGGVSAWPPIRRELIGLLGDTNAVAVTTMLDLYALPGDVPGVDESRGLPPYKRVAAIESAIANVFNDERLRPYVQLHEFEAFVFTAPDTAATRSGTAAVGAMISEAVRRAGGVELVNEGPTTAPSKRIKSVWPGYVKTIDGPAIAGVVGLEGLRRSCPHFDAWVGWLEGL